MTRMLIMMPTGIPLEERSEIGEPLDIEVRNSSLSQKFGKCKKGEVLIKFMGAFWAAGCQICFAKTYREPVISSYSLSPTMRWTAVEGCPA